MNDQENDGSYSSGWYLLGGLLIGAAAGLLLAPKKGSEMREDIDEWRRRTREKSREMLTRIGNSLPSRAAVHESVDKTKQFVGK